MDPFNWTCPYCGHHTTITDPNFSRKSDAIGTENSLHGDVALQHEAVSCPNPACRELTLVLMLRPRFFKEGWKLGKAIHTWSLLPRSRAKPQPDYIPAAIRQDYEEACRILNDSPKASATMSRRCLQGVVRDFWQIPDNKRGNLGGELSFIKDRVDASTWEVITTIREVGDIGAHMEKDVNYVVEVEPEEAALLIELIETLFADWYVARAGRLDRDAKIKAIASKKLDEKKEAKKLAKASTPPLLAKPPTEE
jgi:hypothetical protein